MKSAKKWNMIHWFMVLLIYLLHSCSDIKEKVDYPFYQQKSPKDCGATCLKMISEYYGKKLTDEYLLKITKTDSIEGVNLLNLSDAADSIELKTLGVKMDFEELCGSVLLPAIVHWDGNHFLVVYEIDKNIVTIADPAAQKKKIDKDEFCRHWLVKPENKGIALLFEKGENF